MLERYQDETDRKMIEEERMRIEREAELQEALELEIAITQMKKEQEEREAEARAIAKEAQASTMVALFRAAHNLTRDRAAMVTVRGEIEALTVREEEIEAELSIVERKAKLASNHRYSTKAMYETCAEQEAKLSAARDRASAVHDDHVREYTSLVEEMESEKTQLEQKIIEISEQISVVSAELATKRTEDKAIKRNKVKGEIAQLNAKADALRESAANDRLHHTEAFQVLPGQRRQVNKIKMSVRAQELTQEDLDRDYHQLAKDVAVLEQEAERDEARLESDLQRYADAKEMKQQLINERAFLSKNHDELEKYVNVRNNKLGDFDRDALQAALRAESDSQCSSRRGGSRRCRTPNSNRPLSSNVSTPGTPRSTSRAILPVRTSVRAASTSMSPNRYVDATTSPATPTTTGHPMRNASALLRRINTQVEKRHPATPRAQRLQM